MAYYLAFGPFSPPEVTIIVSYGSILYIPLIPATLLWCTILIVYRILRVGGAAGRIHVYQRLIEMLVESASLYSAVLVVDEVLEARNEVASFYIGVFVIATRVSMSNLLCICVITKNFLLGNHANNASRPCCSGTCTPR